VLDGFRVKTVPARRHHLEGLIEHRRKEPIAALPPLDTFSLPNIESIWLPWSFYNNLCTRFSGPRAGHLNDWSGHWFEFRYWTESGKVEMTEMNWEDVKLIWNHVIPSFDRCENHPRIDLPAREWSHNQKLIAKVTIVRPNSYLKASDKKKWIDVQPYREDEDTDSHYRRMFWMFLARLVRTLMNQMFPRVAGGFNH
jgi:hypothetical protein